MILIWYACWKVCWEMSLEFTCTQCAMCSVIETTLQIMKHVLQLRVNFKANPVHNVVVVFNAQVPRKILFAF